MANIDMLGRGEVSSIRIFFSRPDSDRKSSDVGGGGRNGILQKRSAEASGNTNYLVDLFLVSEDFSVFLSFLGDCNVFVPSDKCAENTAIAWRV